MKKVEVILNIQTTPERIIQSFIDIDMLRNWWGVEKALIAPKVNGVYTLAWNVQPTGFGYVSTGIISAYVPERLLCIDQFVYLNPERSILGPMQLKVEAMAKESGSTVVIQQGNYQEGGDWDWYFDAVTNAWPIVAENLKKYLERQF